MKVFQRKLKKLLLILPLDPTRVFYELGFFKCYMTYFYKKGEYFIKQHSLSRILLEKLSVLSSKSAQHKAFDLYHLDSIITKRLPEICLEFGSGLSTLVIAHRLYILKKKSLLKSPKIYSIETDESYGKEIEQIIPDHLKDIVKIIISPSKASILDSQLVCYHDCLPDISPDFIYLDGPAQYNIEGSIKCGLSFKSRATVSADLLLYESTLKTGTCILVDGRRENVEFLKNTFLKSYKVKTNKLLGYSLFFLKGRWEYA